MAFASVASVEEKYAHLEEYLENYIESLAYNAKRKLIFFYYFRNHGIVLPNEDVYDGFPSYSHWRFLRVHKITTFSFSS